MNNNNTEITLDQRSHAFNVGIAIDYSPTMSLWLGHLALWIHVNIANNKNIHEGRGWSFQTLDAIQDYFPYFTKKQIETMVNNSVKEGLVIKGNYNQTAYDRTVWYALTDKALAYFKHLMISKYEERLKFSISQKGEMENPKMGDGNPQKGTPIPDTKKDTKPDTKSFPDSSNRGTHRPIASYKKDERFMRFYNAYPLKEDPRDAHKAFKSIVGNDDELLEHIISDIEERKKKHSRWADKKFIKYPAVYLRKSEYDGEIYNERDEAREKKQKAEQEAAERLKTQEAYSKARADKERIDHLNKHNDGLLKREINKGVLQGRTAPPQELLNLARGLRGIKS